MCERPDLSGRAPSRVDSLSRFPSRPVLVGPSPFAPRARHITARARRRAQRPHTMRAIAPVSLAPVSRVQRRRARVQARRTTDDVTATGAASLGLAAAAAACVVLAGPARAELNAAEANRGGEFNRGSAKQFGGYDLVKVDITKEFGEDLRLSVRDDARFARRTRRSLEARSLARDVLTEIYRFPRRRISRARICDSPSFEGRTCAART